MRLVVSDSKNLSGKIFISGAKNAILPIMAASLLTKEDVVILDVPDISDIDVMCKILKSIGSKIKRENRKLIINNRDIKPASLDFKMMEMIRGSCLILGPLLARIGYIKLPFPGGCKIGARPIDLHLDAMRKLGINVDVEGNEITAIGTIKPATIRLEFPSVGATENIMMAGVLSNGYTKIENAAKEPEIYDLGKFLISMGAKIYGHGTDTIIIQGSRSLSGSIYTPISDRIEAGTYMIAVAATNSDVVFENVNPKFLNPVIFKLRQMGIVVNTYYNTIRVRSKDEILPTNIICMPHPSFPTDLQAPMCSLMSVSSGTCIVEEKIFNNRFMHISELIKMGADIELSGNLAKINGVTKLFGKCVEAKDLRGGAALVIAGMIASGKTYVAGTKYILRGYENMVEKLKNIGVNIEWEK